jgi:hypothetical protein
MPLAYKDEGLFLWDLACSFTKIINKRGWTYSISYKAAKGRILILSSIIVTV